MQIMSTLSVFPVVTSDVTVTAVAEIAVIPTRCEATTDSSVAVHAGVFVKAVPPNVHVYVPVASA
jgi:hypothetical protein